MVTVQYLLVRKIVMVFMRMKMVKLLIISMVFLNQLNTLIMKSMSNVFRAIKKAVNMPSYNNDDNTYTKENISYHLLKFRGHDYMIGTFFEYIKYNLVTQ
jgi:hypothetical protein